MHFWPEMVLGVVAVVKEKPVVDFSVTAHAPGNRFIGVRAVMTVVTVQITKAMAEIPEWQEKQHESPVDEMNRFGRDNDRHHQKRGHHRRDLNDAPEQVAVIALAQFSADCAPIISKEAEKKDVSRYFYYV